MMCMLQSLPAHCSTMTVLTGVHAMGLKIHAGLKIRAVDAQVGAKPERGETCKQAVLRVQLKSSNTQGQHWMPWAGMQGPGS